MKYNILLLGLALLQHFPLWAQDNNNLRGKMLYQNSGKQPAVGVAMKGTIEKTVKAHETYTIDDGSYRLVFPLARVGHRVALYIDKKDGKGRAIEVVNQREVEACRIPANATEPFLIIVCTKGARSVAAAKYYKVIKASSEQALAEKKRELEALLAAQVKDYEKIAASSERISRLAMQTDSLSIYREAYRLASINRDFASDRVRQYLDSLDAEVPVQRAREVLNIAAAAQEADESKEQFWAAIQEMGIWAEGSIIFSDYKNAIAWYDTVLVKLEEMGIDRAIKARYYTDASIIMEQGGETERALSYSLKAIAIQEQVDTLHPYLPQAYKRLSTTYLMLNAKEESLEYALRSYRILKQNEASDLPEHPDLMALRDRSQTLLRDIGQRQLDEKDYPAAVETFSLAVQDFEEADFYYYQGLASYHLGQYPQATEAYQIAGALEPTRWEDSLWCAIGHAYLKNGDFKAAKMAYENYEAKQPQKEQSYRNWTMYYALKGKKRKALAYLKKAMTLGFDDVYWLETEDSLDGLREKRCFLELIGD